MEVIKELNWYIQSRQRAAEEQINDFMVPVPNNCLDITAGQRLRFKFVAFNGLNSFYNVSDQNNTFYINESLLCTLTPGFYTDFTTICTAIQSAIRSCGIVALQNLTVARDPISGLGQWSNYTKPFTITFPPGRNSHALMGFPYNEGLPIFISEPDPTYLTPLPMMYNYLQNINVRAEFPGIQNIERQDKITQTTKLFAKIPVDAKPFENIWFNPQDTDQFVVLSAGTGAQISQVRFFLTDDFRTPLQCFYDWEAVVRVEIIQDNRAEMSQWRTNISKGIDNILLLNNDLEHILLGEPREHEDVDTVKKSILQLLVENMTAFNTSFDNYSSNVLTKSQTFLDHFAAAFNDGDTGSGNGSVFKMGEQSVFRARNLVGLEGTIAGFTSDLSGHFSPTGDITIGLAAIAATSGAEAITGFAKQITDTISEINKFTEYFQSDGLPKIIKPLKDQADTSKELTNYIKGGKVTGYTLLGTRSVEDGIKSYLENLATSIDYVSDVITNKASPDIVEAITNKELPEIGKLTETIAVKEIPNYSNVLANIHIPDYSNVLTLSSLSLSKIATFEPITKSLYAIYEAIMKPTNRTTYIRQITELNNLINKNASTDEINKWVRANDHIVFDPQTSDRNSFDEMISVAKTLQEKTGNKELEQWINNLVH